ncbi:squalene synthase HpnC [Hydrogenophaga sp. OTU3427]|uniref:squalene synthase HpnC n=1 Tax=Hydrogenophaga sp. OTU3427 TaxID=3043856 RepID=UPI00313B8F41
MPPPPTPSHAPPPGTGLAALGHGGTQHYENFPVASWLCPPALRAPILAIYRFARVADDIADEGDAPATQRLQDLARYRVTLARAANGETPTGNDWPEVFGPLATVIRRHALPPTLLHDLLSAFEQDVRYTSEGRRYGSHDELLDYCRLSANPVGRLLLHLYGVHDSDALRRSDQVCSALQLINFWQDLSVDLPRQRHYLPRDVLQRHGVDEAGLLALSSSAAPAAAMVADLCARARALMLAGAPLALQLPGRGGWELRLVVQGGLRLLDHIAAIGHTSWRQRPRLRPMDLPVLLWRASRMELPTV